ncbi:MAG: putative DNA binding domain-containing protein [Coxiellaceae bacterium]|nr:MAG: putative DNA binding domain-containing protein [Coxiellaceae bacterium]
MITIETLEGWLSTPHENERLDFKEAKQQYDITKLLRYCVAFANELGGHLVLGVSDERPRKVVGTQAFLNVGNVKYQILNKLHFRVEVYELQHPDGRVLVFEIPSRPIGKPQELDGAYWMRSGESLVPMTQDQLKRIFAEGQPNFLNHDATSAISSDEVVALLDVQKFFDLIKLPLPATRDAILNRLISEKFVRSKNNEFFITNLGAILLAKDLRNFESVNRKTVRIIKYKDNNKVNTEREHTIAKGYAVGFEDLIDYINNQLPANEMIGKALREEVRMYPELVIREVMANALVHQDLDLTGSSVMVEIYSDRIEFTNPGQPLIKAERFVDEYRSRNESLADVMRRMGICEAKGSGIDKVVFNTELYQLPAHDVRVTTSHTTVVLFSYKEFRLMDNADRLRACYLHCCLKYVSNERMTNQSLRERFKLEDTRAKSAIVSQIIAASVEQGEIKPDDPGSASKRYAKYVPYWA